MKLGKPEYVAWVIGGGPCEFRPTLLGAIRAARACEARGGRAHSIWQLRSVKVPAARPRGQKHKRSER